MAGRYFCRTGLEDIVAAGRSASIMLPTSTMPLPAILKAVTEGKLLTLPK